MAANMDGVGTRLVATEFKELDLFTCLKKSLTLDFFKEGCFDAEIEDNAAITIGVTSNDFAMLYKLKDNIKYVCVDVANGYTKRLVSIVRDIRSMPTKKNKLVIIAGNVVTSEMVEELLLAGADIIKVGIGGGSVCTTRIKTGIGYPQLSAVIECADAAHGVGGHIIADGGCNSSGDIVKAFAAGADFVMIGGMLSGHNECDGELIFEDDNPEPIGMEFYGMASKTAMDKYGHSNREYRGEEGKSVIVPYRGVVRDTVIDILSGVRSACTYVGAKRLKDLTKCATFVRVNSTHNRIYE